MTENKGSKTNLGSYRSLTGLTFVDTPDTRKKPQGQTNNQAEKKRATLDGRHRYFIDKIAEMLNEKTVNVEDAMLVGNRLDLVNTFLKDNGSKKLLVFVKTAKARHV
jgi:hypothetical protein